MLANKRPTIAKRFPKENKAGEIVVKNFVFGLLLFEDFRVQTILIDELYLLARLCYLRNVDNSLHLEAHKLTIHNFRADGLLPALNKPGEVIIENFTTSLDQGDNNLVS
jgi:hypothetical protein